MGFNIFPNNQPTFKVINFTLEKCGSDNHAENNYEAREYFTIGNNN